MGNLDDWIAEFVEAHEASAGNRYSTVDDVADIYEEEALQKACEIATVVSCLAPITGDTEMFENLLKEMRFNLMRALIFFDVVTQGSELQMDFTNAFTGRNIHADIKVIDEDEEEEDSVH